MLCRDGAGAMPIFVFVQGIAVECDVAATAGRICFCNVECEELDLRAKSDVTTARLRPSWLTYCSGDENILHNLCYVKIDKGKRQCVFCVVQISLKLGKTMAWLTAHHYQSGCSSFRAGGPQSPRPAQWLPPKLGHASRQARQPVLYAKTGGETQHGTTMTRDGRRRKKQNEDGRTVLCDSRTTMGHVNQGLRLADGRARGGDCACNCTFFALPSETRHPPCPGEY